MDLGQNIVIGSGPSGIACAKGILEAGGKVLMLDVGRTLPTQITEKVTSLKKTPEENWSQKQRNSIFGAQEYDPEKNSRKLKFTSDFAYAEDQELNILQKETDLAGSFAKGGFSNIWGAATLPWSAADTKDWPVDYEDLKKYFKKVASYLKISGPKDDLESLHPFYGEPSESLEPSEQYRKILKKLNLNKNQLKKDGISFGLSRLAMDNDPTSNSFCQRIGQCLEGCPYDSIFCTTQILENLKENPDFEYMGGIRALELEEKTDGGILIKGKTEASQTLKTFEGERVFVGGGVLATMQLLMNSFDLDDCHPQIHFNPYFLTPAIAFSNTSKVDSEKTHTLSQVFLEIFDQQISKHQIHLQAYGYNPMLKQYLHKKTSFVGGFGIAKKLFLGRMLAIQGYLNSQDADPITLKISKNSDHRQFQLDGKLKADTIKKMHQTIDKINQHSKHTGIKLLKPMTTFGKPGAGNHVGGSFPMKHQPIKGQCDSLGKLFGTNHVHLVDASVLPSLGSPTITYSVMANAHRIGFEVTNQKRGQS